MTVKKYVDEPRAFAVSKCDRLTVHLLRRSSPLRWQGSMP
jgi:hypothetical protein